MKVSVSHTLISKKALGNIVPDSSVLAINVNVFVVLLYELSLMTN
jgi:hypothetical protein